MPIDLEMLLSSSNHAFFPYSFYDDYDSTYNRSLSFPQNHCVPRSPIKHQSSFPKKAEHDSFSSAICCKTKDKVAPRQECYGVRKKKVSFADDKGFKLVEVREIPGAPKWADDVITLLIGSAKRSVVKEKKWKIAFEHPPWSDEKLMDALEINMVALEHIFVKEGTDDYLIGAVKVKNIAFQKNIFLRVTFDRWLSYVDIPCTYMKPNKKCTAPNKYDTFYFKCKILPVASRYEVIEFCICFECNGREYWDNNGGINYRLTAEYSKSAATDVPETNIPRPYYSESASSLSETIQSAEKIDTWSKLIQNEAYW